MSALCAETCESLLRYDRVYALNEYLSSTVLRGLACPSPLQLSESHL